MIVVHSGKLQVQEEQQHLTTGWACKFKAGEGEEVIKFTALENNTKFILMAGQPIDEPIVSKGPFVMSSEEEMDAAYDDFLGQKNGFEGVRTWNSDIKYMKYSRHR